MVRLLAIGAFCLTATCGWAGSFQSVSWSDLAEGLDATKNPYYGLSADQARLLRVLVDTAAAREAGSALSERDLKGEEIALAALDSVGVDGASKVRAVQQFGDELAASRSELNEDLLGRDIEIPGFMLPLEFDGATVTEFLLVPIAGACVHVPPPPGNQIIHITSSDGFKMRGLFDPVVVRGRLSSSGEQMSVDLSDGNADFPVGYSMQSDSIELFR